jgi:hypothetical protein
MLGASGVVYFYFEEFSAQAMMSSTAAATRCALDGVAAGVVTAVALGTVTIHGFSIDNIRRTASRFSQRTRAARVGNDRQRSIGRSRTACLRRFRCTAFCM